MTFNSDTSTHYAQNGVSQQAASSPAALNTTSAANCIAGIFSTLTASFVSDISFYADTNFAKSVLTHGSGMTSTGTATNNFDFSGACSWDNGGTPAAITSVTLTVASGNYVAGSKFMILVQD